MEKARLIEYQAAFSLSLCLIFCACNCLCATLFLPLAKNKLEILIDNMPKQTLLD